MAQCLYPRLKTLLVQLESFATFLSIPSRGGACTARGGFSPAVWKAGTSRSRWRGKRITVYIYLQFPHLKINNLSNYVKVSGVDLAFVSDGYAYHTAHDDRTVRTAHFPRKRLFFGHPGCSAFCVHHPFQGPWGIFATWRRGMGVFGLQTLVGRHRDLNPGPPAWESGV